MGLPEGVAVVVRRCLLVGGLLEQPALPIRDTRAVGGERENTLADDALEVGAR